MIFKKLLLKVKCTHLHCDVQKSLAEFVKYKEKVASKVIQEAEQLAANS